MLLRVRAVFNVAVCVLVFIITCRQTATLQLETSQNFYFVLPVSRDEFKNKITFKNTWFQYHEFSFFF